ncbi:hypothetical protein NG799_19160 [Laspinema sp. D1]|uniref:Uncharacterized protein n=1 Tax=Laspinema palackyanum D2a TaxID=2953684 RepID=A0ABT2MVA2_9CYAN|nr:hypothetical protein [Laspinema sp. D2a]
MNHQHHWPPTQCQVVLLGLKKIASPFWAIGQPVPHGTPQVIGYLRGT